MSPPLTRDMMVGKHSPLAPNDAAASGSAPVPASTASPAWTAGPWIVERTPDFAWIGPAKAAGHKVGGVVARIEIDRTYRDEVRARLEANARLISAAPDLAEAAFLIVSSLDENGEFVLQQKRADYLRGVTAARAALAKANDQ